MSYFQAIPGNDQNASSTNQKTAGTEALSDKLVDVLWPWKAFQVVFWCEYVCWDVHSDTS